MRGLTRGVKGRNCAFTLIELLIVVAVVFVCGGWALHEYAKLSAPLNTGPMPGYNGGFADVGIRVKKNEKSGAIQIAEVYSNSPAAAAKLSAGLIIEEINGTPTQGKSEVECQIRILGKAGTKIRLKLVNSDRNETNEVELTRPEHMASKQS